MKMKKKTIWNILYKINKKIKKKNLPFLIIKKKCKKNIKNNDNNKGYGNNNDEVFDEKN